MRYTLDKMSSPGWIFKTDHLEHIHWMLDQHVCKQCKWQRADYEKWKEENPKDAAEAEEYFDLEDGWNPYTYTDMFPDNYEELPLQEKVDLLMDTACGCEFDLIDSEDPESGKFFVEIEV